MFTSQPQIGQDMASERQRQAAQIRQASEARTAQKSTQIKSPRRRVGVSGLRRRLAILARRLASPRAGWSSTRDRTV